MGLVTGTHARSARHPQPAGSGASPYGHSSRLSFDSFFYHIKQIKVRRVRRRQSARY